MYYIRVYSVHLEMFFIPYTIEKFASMKIFYLFKQEQIESKTGYFLLSQVMIYSMPGCLQH